MPFFQSPKPISDKAFLNASAPTASKSIPSKLAVYDKLPVVGS